MVGMRLGQFERVGGGQINALHGDPATRLPSRSAECTASAVPNRSMAAINPAAMPRGPGPSLHLPRKFISAFGARAEVAGSAHPHIIISSLLPKTPIASPEHTEDVLNRG